MSTMLSAAMDKVWLMHQKEQWGTLNQNWVLLDNCSSCHIMINRNIVTNTQKAKKKLLLHCQVGTTTTDLEANFGFWGPQGVFLSRNQCGQHSLDEQVEEGHVQGNLQ